MRRVLTAAASVASAAAAAADPNAIVLTVDASTGAPWRAISPTLHSAFLEDINHAVTGGLSGEMIADPGARGPWVGHEDPPGTTRLSLESQALPGLFIRGCGGAVANPEGGILQTMWEGPGLDDVACGAAPAGARCVSYQVVSFLGAPNYLIAKTDGVSMDVAASDGSGTFVTRATWFVSPATPGGNASLVTLASAAFAGKVVTIGPEQVNGGCTWIGERYELQLAVPAASPPPPGQTWALTPPLCVESASWLASPAAGFNFTADFGSPSPPVSPNVTTALVLSVTPTTNATTTRRGGVVVPARRRSLRGTPAVGAPGVAYGPGVCNVGFFGGMPLVAAQEYMLSFAGMAISPKAGASTGDAAAMPPTVWFTLEDADGNVLDGGNQPLAAAPVGQWSVYSGIPLSPLVNTTGRLCLRSNSEENPGGVSFAVTSVSLTPYASFKTRPRGMRADIGAAVAALRPAVFRFPGGTWILGTNASDWYDFRRTVGDVTTRAGHWDLWGYRSTDFSGLYEYLQFCEDAGASPLFVANAGLFNDGTHVSPGAGLQDFIDHAIAALDFANADHESGNYWASLRAQMGHPAPFNMTHMAIGNENGGDAYATNYAAMYAAVKAAYPGVTLVANLNLDGNPATVGFNSWGGRGRGLDGAVPREWGGVGPTDAAIAAARAQVGAPLPVDLYDFHNYWPYEQMVSQQFSWDAYPRTSPKVFNSEFATKPSGRGNLLGALGDAVWMTGLERNSDVVTMAAYAPLLVSTHDVAWLPDAIVFNGTSVYGIPSYWVQVLFANHTRANESNVLLPFTAAAPAGGSGACERAAEGGVCAGDLVARFGVPVNVTAANFSASVSATNGTVGGRAGGALVVKAVNTAAVARPLTLALTGAPQPAGLVAQRWTITGPALTAENTLDDPTAVAPVYDVVPVGPGATVTLPPWSVTVLRVPLTAA